MAVPDNLSGISRKNTPLAVLVEQAAEYWLVLIELWWDTSARAVWAPVLIVLDIIG
jgi:hypothetical protein